ncbi:Uncharacterised protein [Yersinia mollaretii]|uniref:hypothetical protein n=1 Tax=Yersinia mollaretii TaxID=33060 RepID=UPI0005E65D4E|nr:hypothetical protein [Yersinia mollaretii]CNJ92512.1 Uncharacterised protein [Yersinia mollaretii]
MTNLGMLKDHLALGEGYSDGLLQVLQSALNEITAARVRLLELGGYSPAATANLVTGCGKVTQCITHFRHNNPYSTESTALIDLLVTHQNQHSIISQQITITYGNSEWTAQVDLNNFPGHNSPAGAMTTLSDWLIRLGLAARGSEGLNAQLGALWTEN